MNRDIATLREVVTKLVPMLSERGIKVTQMGSQAMVRVDPRTGQPLSVNLPYLPDNASNELIRAVWGFLDHECAHMLFTDFEVVARCARRGDETLSSLLNIIEDTFIERRMRMKFPGSAGNMKNVCQFVLDTVTTPMLAGAATPLDFFNILLMPAMRAWAGQDVAVEYMKDKWTLIDEQVKAIGDLAKEIPNVASTEQSLDLAERILAALMDAAERKARAGRSSGSGSASASKTKGSGEKLRRGKPTKGDEGDGETSSGDMPDIGGAVKGDRDKSEDDESEESSGKDKKSGDRETKRGVGSEGGGGSADVAPEVKAGARHDLGDEDDDADSEDEDKDDGHSDDGHSDDGYNEEDRDDAVEDEEPEGYGSGDAEGADDTGGGKPKHTEDGDEGEEVDPEGAEDESEEDEEAERLKEELRKAIAEADDLDSAAGEKISEEAVKASKDADYLVFTNEEDKIETLKSDVASLGGEVATMEMEIAHMLGRMQKDLERAIAARTRTRLAPGFKRGRLNGAALHRLATEDDRVFRRKEISKSKETAVELVIDLSGSMGGKIRTAMIVAFALSSVLERIGVANEVIGFTTIGTGSASYKKEMDKSEAALGRSYSRCEPLYMPIFKNFGERLTTDVKARFPMPYQYHFCLANNVDGECVQIAAERLMKRREPRKVMMVLSDGAPSAMGSYLEQSAHLKNVVRKVERMGVETIGIGIMTDAVRQYYTKNVVLHSVSQLPTTVMKEITRILLA